MAVADNYCYFFDDDEFHETGRPGFRRRVISGERLQLWFWRIKGGAAGSILHSHVDNEQLGIIVRGSLEFRIGGSGDDALVTLGPGEAYLAPPGVPHGDSTFIGDGEFGEVWILDVFAPPREDVS